MAKNLTTYLLHGWTTDTTKWEPLIKLLKSQGLKIKLLKIPGLTSELKKVWTLDDYIHWFSKITDSQPHFNVIAHSFGGRIAIRFDVKNPNRIKKLVLIDSAGIKPAGIKARFKRTSFKLIAKIGKKITKSPNARRLLYKVAREKDYFQANQTLAKTMANIIEQDQTKELSFVKAHTLIVWGELDQVTPLSDGRTMNKHIVGSSLKIVSKAKHSPQYSHTKTVANHLGDFLKTQDK